MELKTNNNPVLKKYYKDYCLILTKVIKEAKKMDYDKHIANSNNIMRTTWKLIDKELGKGKKKPWNSNTKYQWHGYNKPAEYCQSFQRTLYNLAFHDYS